MQYIFLGFWLLYSATSSYPDLYQQMIKCKTNVICTWRDAVGIAMATFKVQAGLDY
jgi:hypothetical protein